MLDDTSFILDRISDSHALTAAGAPVHAAREFTVIHALPPTRDAFRLGHLVGLTPIQPLPTLSRTRYRRKVARIDDPLFTERRYSTADRASAPAISKLIATKQPHPIVFSGPLTLPLVFGSKQPVVAPPFEAQSTNFWISGCANWKTALYGQPHVSLIAAGMLPASALKTAGTSATQPTLLPVKPLQLELCTLGGSRTEEAAGIPVGMADADDEDAVLVDVDEDDEDLAASELDEGMLCGHTHPAACLLS
ncbi:hypothetical protein B0H16DRAFT_1893360 [Mycena metata]|uniref:Uncharacterized protein n=1 Tax=Mycena metata TaxID=1033252 RepID=A0AAD7HZ36_9AGAR|nr:hypothetical protein B0H16DRAFT_1893360 [Mycena metata]